MSTADKEECKICHGVFIRLRAHVTRTHEMTWENYQQYEPITLPDISAEIADTEAIQKEAFPPVKPRKRNWWKHCLRREK